MSLVGGTFVKEAFNASDPPADAPNPTNGNDSGADFFSILPVAFFLRVVLPFDFDCGNPVFVSFFSGS
ncbi:hypothetical protein [Desulfobacter hydrogenophilus]|uniref:hypothetical protein n=1 Tax=Desulfobacter hydrogenophilus TaxID=2291 RepID=UPI001A93D0B6|nr:hypothetical protein [Desulfobacter hydrogenophilus]